ncbi:MAG: hypothetical protein ACU83N_15835 [Gammaproteobacteria bacterium]
MKSIDFKILIIGIIAMVFGMISLCQADQKVTIAWSWDANTPAPDGYRLFKRDQAGQYNYTTPAWQDTATTASFTLPNGAYAFVCRAFVGDSESQNSNEVLFIVEDQAPPVIVPGQPKQLIIKFE